MQSFLLIVMTSNLIILQTLCQKIYSLSQILQLLNINLIGYQKIILIKLQLNINTIKVNFKHFYNQIRKKPKENLDQGLKEDMNSIVANCQNVISVKQAIIKVDTIQVNFNIAFENIVMAFMPDVALKNAYTLWEEFLLRFARETEIARYIKQKETFCRYQNYHLNYFLQLSYKHYILSEQVFLNYQIKCDQFAEEFNQAHQQFKKYHETLLQSRINNKSRRIRRW